MDQEIIPLLVKLAAIILTVSTRVELLIKDTAVMEKKLEWCAKVSARKDTLKSLKDGLFDPELFLLQYSHDHVSFTSYQCVVDTINIFHMPGKLTASHLSKFFITPAASHHYTSLRNLNYLTITHMLYI